MSFRSPYDSNQIREGLMNIKHSQMELLKQLRNQHQSLKKYTPNNQIPQQDGSSVAYRSVQPDQGQRSMNQSNDFIRVDQIFSRQKKQNDEIRLLKNQIQTINEDYQKMKRNYYSQKQKNKDLILHMEFISSMHNIILKEVLAGNNLDNIKGKVRNQVKAHQSQFSDFKAVGIEQAFNIINLQNDTSFTQYRQTKRKQHDRKTNQNYPPLPPQKDSQNNKSLDQNNIILNQQISNLKIQINSLLRQKQSKQHNIIENSKANEQTIVTLRRQLDIKNTKLTEITQQLLKLNDTNRNLGSQNRQLRNNIDRIKNQLQRYISKTQNYQSLQQKTSQTIQKQHKYLQFLKQLEEKVSFYEKQAKQKGKLIEIHQQNVNKLNQVSRHLKTENQRLRKQNEQIKKQIQKLKSLNQDLQQKNQRQREKGFQDNKMIIHRNEQQITSLKNHINQLKQNIAVLMKNQQIYKSSQNALKEIQLKKIQAMKINKGVDHLWHIKQVQYDNIHEILSNLKKSNSQTKKK